MEKIGNYSKEKEQIEKIPAKGIIAGGPAIGKTHFMESQNDNIQVSDMDSSDYRDNPTWPQNYIADIIKNIDNFELLLISTHPEVVQALRGRGFEVTVVCINETEVEYTERLRERGNDEATIEMFLKNSFKTEDQNRSIFPGGKIIFLPATLHLEDILDLDN